MKRNTYHVRVAHKRRSFRRWAFLALLLPLFLLWGKFTATSLTSEGPIKRIFHAPTATETAQEKLEETPGIPSASVRQPMATMPTYSRAPVPSAYSNDFFPPESDRSDPRDIRREPTSIELKQATTNFEPSRDSNGGGSPLFQVQQDRPKDLKEKAPAPKEEKKEKREKASSFDYSNNYRFSNPAIRKDAVKNVSRSEPTRGVPLDKFSFQVVDFQCGVDNEEKAGNCLPRSNRTLTELLMSDEANNKDDVPLMRRGWIRLSVEGGEIVDRPGPDFVVVTSYSPIANPYPARVSVSETGNPDSFVSFPCSKTVPTFCTGEKSQDNEFDLEKIKVTRAKYIRIEDIGNLVPDDSVTPGAKIGGIRFVHAEAEQHPEEVAAQ